MKERGGVRAGVARIAFVTKRYRRSFLVVGLVYGAIVLIMNMTLLSANVNYYGAIKRSTAVFGTIYGLYVLREGDTGTERFARFLVSLTVLLGIVLIVAFG